MTERGAGISPLPHTKPLKYLATIYGHRANARWHLYPQENGHRLRLYRLSLVLLALVLASCSRESSPVGIEILPDNDFIGIRTYDSAKDSSVAATSSTYEQPITASSSTIISVGSTAGYRSYCLMRWLFLPDSIGERGRIVEARVTMRPLGYHIGNGSSPLQFDVKEITSPWSSFTFTSKSLDTLGVDQMPKGMFSGVIEDSVSIAFDIDTSLARKWLKLSAEYKNFDIRGILLDPSAYTSNVRAFQSAFGDVPPKLSIVVEHQGILDTIEGGALEDTYVATGPTMESGSGMMLHGGLAYRGKLNIDVSAIPPKSIINNVKLYLTRDSLKTFKNYRGIDTILVYVSTNDETNTFPASGVMTRKGAHANEFIAEGGLLTAAVQDWIAGKKNNGFIFIRLAEVSDLDQMWFYGVDAPPDKRPRLEITYTTEP